MKILFDHQRFSAQEYGGITKYFSELMSELSNLNINIELPILYTNNNYLQDNNNFNFKSFFKNKRFKGKNFLIDKINNLYMINHLKRNNDYDIFHPTYFSPYFLDLIKKKPFVLTVYDLIYEVFEEYDVEPFKTVMKFRKELINRSERIIAISENTKKDLQEIYMVNPEKIKVVHLANSLKENKKFKLDLPRKYLLFIGKRDNYKNFLFLLDSIQSIFKNDNNFNLLCIGGGEFSKNELDFMNEKNLPTSKIKYMSVSDKYLPFIYKNALAFIYPSKYEGFGIPILEAFSNNCPVILSNSSCFPEVANDSAEYFNPNIKESILKAVKKVIYDNYLRNDLIKKGNLRSKNFSWEKTAKETLLVYENILK